MSITYKDAVQLLKTKYGLTDKQVDDVYALGRDELKSATFNGHTFSSGTRSNIPGDDISMICVQSRDEGTLFEVTSNDEPRYIMRKYSQMGDDCAAPDTCYCNACCRKYHQ